MSESHPNLESLVHAVSQIESNEERADFLEKNCGGDHELRRLVEQRLGNADVGKTAFQDPAEQHPKTRGHAGTDKDLTASLDAGLALSFDCDTAVFVGDAGHSVLKSLGNTLDHVPQLNLRSDDEESDPTSASQRTSSSPLPESRYVLEGEIARGGMGAILKGRDTDLGRDLAIKVLLDSSKRNPEVIQRFVEEAQIGGQLQHPGIAPVYELGQFADERPFFSMKLVKGETLSKLLADRQDSASERSRFVGIFEQICQTMAYAHSRGVIHRDLKPANIMVGAFGEVQVMDWGLAKVLTGDADSHDPGKHEDRRDKSVIRTLRSQMGQELSGSAESARSETQTGSVMGTPAYMPPEQAAGAVDQLDSRADVFGLGAILCQILTGQPPYTGNSAMEIYRQAVAGKLENAFSRLDDCGADLELIELAKACLAIEPNDRPKDASVLASRVTGYLESVEQKLRDTELAKADAQIRAEELRRRQKLTVKLGAAVAAALVIGISASLWQMYRAKEAEGLAKRETNRATAAEKETAMTLVKVKAERDAKELARKEAEQISTFLTEVFQSPDPDRDGREITVAELLDRAVKKLETELVDQPEQRNRLLKTLGDSYYSLGLLAEATKLDEQMRDYYLQTFGPDHPSTLKATGDLTASYEKAGRIEEAIQLLVPALESSRKTLGSEHKVTIGVMSKLAYSYRSAGRLDESVALGEEVLSLCRKAYPPEHSLAISAMTNLAQFYRDVGRRDEALQLLEDVLPLARKVNGESHSTTRVVMSSLATSYQMAGRLNESIKLQESLVPIFQEVQGPEHPDTLAAKINLASALKNIGRTDDAIKLSEEALVVFREVFTADHPNALRGMNVLASSYQLVGQRVKALDLRKEVLELTKMKLGPEHPMTIIAMNNLANSLHSTGRRVEALKLRENVLDLRMKILGPEHPDTITAMGNLAESYRTVKRNDEALRMLEEANAKFQETLGHEHPKTLTAMNDLAIAYTSAGRLAEAIELQEKVVLLRRKVLGEEHMYTLRAMTNLAGSYAMAGRGEEAVELCKNALTLAIKVLGQEHPSTLRAMDRLANIYGNTEKWVAAAELGEQVVILSRKVLGDAHPKTRGSISRLANYVNGVVWPMVSAPDTEGCYPLATEAVSRMRRACELSPNNGSLLNTLGLAHYRAQEWSEAVEALMRSTQLGFDIPHNWLFIAMSHWGLGEKEKAQTWYKKSLDWRSENQAALEGDPDLQRFFKEAKKLMEPVSGSEGVLP